MLSIYKDIDKLLSSPILSLSKKLVVGLSTNYTNAKYLTRKKILEKKVTVE